MTNFTLPTDNVTIPQFNLESSYTHLTNQKQQESGPRLRFRKGKSTSKRQGFSFEEILNLRVQRNPKRKQFELKREGVLLLF